jgi:hypothetical protein
VTERAASRRPPRLLAALTAVVSLAACLALAGAYYAGRARAYASLDLVLEGDDPIEPDDAIGFVPAANAAGARRHPRAGTAYHVYTSARRARVDAPGEQTPATVDLLTVGCSFSWGHGVENPDTYTSVLARRMGIRAANLAYSAYGTAQSVLLLERALDLRPKVVVYGLIQDHMKRNVSGCAPVYGPACLPSPWVDFDAGGKPFLRSPDRAAYDFNRRFWDAFFFRRASWPRRLALAVEADLRLLSPPRFGDPDPAARGRAMAFLLGRMRDAASRAGARLVIAYIPYLERGTTNTPSPVLAEVLSALEGPEVAVVDLAPVVAGHYADPAAPRLRFERDAHPNPAGHALIADHLEPVLRAAIAR